MAYGSEFCRIIYSHNTLHERPGQYSRTPPYGHLVITASFFFFVGPAKRPYIPYKKTVDAVT